jgi:hypothetical protein
MKLPKLDNPQRYRGLYVFDFGEWTAVGYTAEEIAVLLESDAYCAGHVYKIIRVTPDGQMELRGVSAERFQLESGMFFNRDELSAARTDFAELCGYAEALGAPCRAFVHLADRGEIEGVPRYVTALIYPAEYEDEMGRWLLDWPHAGGDTVEGGISHVTDYYSEDKAILESHQIWTGHAVPARGAEEVLRSVRLAVQR